MTKEFKFTFEELGIIPNDLNLLLGFEKNEIPEPFPEYIQTALSQAPKLCSIRAGYKIFDSLTIHSENETIQLEDHYFHPAKIIIKELQGSSKAALFICTAGSGISDYSKKIAAEGDPILGYVFDILGSVSVEKATDKMQEALKTQVQQSNLNISTRYSPGYCKWSVAEQHELFALLPPNFCGVTLSESSLMHPIKSVSGIIGIGKDQQQKGYQCQYCSDKNCIYGKLKRRK